MSSASAPRGRGRQSAARTRPAKGAATAPPASDTPSPGETARGGATAPRSTTEPAGLPSAARLGPPSAARLGPPTPRVALLVLTLIAVAVVLYMARGALTPFLIGLVLVYLLDPPVRGRARRGVPAALAVLVVYAATLFVLVEGLALLLRPLIEQLAAFVRDLPAFLAALDDQFRRLTEIYNRIALPAPVRDALDRAAASLTQAGRDLDPTALLPVARTIAGTLAGVFGLLIVPVWAFYILKDRDRLTGAFDRALPPAWREDTWAVLRIVNRVFGRWLRGQLLLGTVVGAATFGGLAVLSLVDGRFLQFAILLAVIAGLLELLPIIGPIIAAIPAILIALTISPFAVVLVVILYTIVQQIENHVLVPKIQGDAVDLHPSIVIFALFVGGAIGGLLGAIFSLPVTAAARDVYRYAFRRLSGVPPTDAIAAIGARERGRPEHAVAPAEREPEPRRSRRAAAAPREARGEG